MQFIAFDTETDLIRPGTNAPELACLSWASPENPTGSVVPAREGLGLLEGWLRDPSVVLIGHNIAYDIVVCFAARPALGPLIRAAYNTGRIRCTQKRGELLDIASGTFRGTFNADGSKTKWGYTLSELHARAGFGHMAKDQYRYSYGVYRWMPWGEWHPDALAYSREDAAATLRVFLCQERHPQRATLVNEAAQVRKALFQELMSAWGMRTRREPVEALRLQVEHEIHRLKVGLVDAGLVKPDGGRNAKVATNRLLTAWRNMAPDERGERRPRLTPTGAKAMRDALGLDEKADLRELDASRYWGAFAALSGGIGLDEDACRASGDPALEAYGEYSRWLKVLSTDIPLLQSGTCFPIHASYGLVESGRSNCFNPNLQNLRGLAGIRECFYPRDDAVYANADYDQLELRTLGQVCKSLFGFSRLGDALVAGVDPHNVLGCTLARIDHVGVTKDDPRIERTRKLAKVANFGFPGGMGWKKMRDYAAGKPNYLTLTDTEAQGLRNAWLQSWPEVQHLFADSKRRLHTGEPVVQLFSGRIRRTDKFAKMNNTWFQGLGADATGEAGWMICEGCYFDPSSPLYGSRMVNYVHDEFILEAPKNRAREAAAELARVMKVGADRFLPDVPSATAPLLMACWSKDAERVEDQNGLLDVWEMDEAA